MIRAALGCLAAIAGGVLMLAAVAVLAIGERIGRPRGK